MKHYAQRLDGGWNQVTPAYYSHLLFRGLTENDIELRLMRTIDRVYVDVNVVGSRAGTSIVSTIVPVDVHEFASGSIVVVDDDGRALYTTTFTKERDAAIVRVHNWLEERRDRFTERMWVVHEYE